MISPDPEHLTCEQLTLLIEGDDTAYPKFHEHLEKCESCQNLLQTSSVESWWWHEGKEFVASSVELLDNQPLTNDGMVRDGKRFDPLVAEIEAIVASFGVPIHPELIGEVGGYEVQSLLGVGGMGAVFRGFDRELNRPIAIKFLLPRHAKSGLARQRFSREAKAIAAVRNDNVIPIYGINSTSNYPYFVMPLIAGVSLEEHVNSNGAMEASQIVQIASQVATGLAAAHAKGLIHRDIKPANILLDNGCNRVVVTDFGLALDEDGLNLTQTGMIAGTPQYMSPEQADGKPLDARSDLFSLGSVIYWMATGQPPFAGNSQLDLLKNIRQQKHADVRSLNPGLPIKLARTVDCLLEKNEIHRFQSADQLERFLTSYSAHLNSPGQNPEPKLKRKRKLRVGSWAIVLLTSLVIALSILLILQSFLVPPRFRKRTNEVQHAQEFVEKSEIIQPAFF